MVAILLACTLAYKRGGERCEKGGERKRGHTVSRQLLGSVGWDGWPAVLGRWTVVLV